MPGKFIKPKQFFEQLKLALVFDEGKEIAPPPRVERHFMGWERPVLDVAVDFFSSGWSGRGALDLSSRLVVTPTRHSGRRLREALAQKAAQFDSAVLPPLVVTPHFLTDPARLEELKNPVPEHHLVTAIWTAALLEIDLEKYRQIFPVDPVDRNLGWAMKVARDLIEVRNLLCQEGLNFKLAAHRLAKAEIEAGRWEQLASLEWEIITLTRKLGFTDPVEAAQQAARTVNIPAEIQRITLIGCTDLHQLVTETLREYSRTFSIDIVIAAQESRKNGFDEWGNPLPEAWLTAEIDIPAPDQTIQSAATPGDQAERVLSLIRRHASPARTAAIGVPDPETIAPVEQLLSASGLSTYDPSGKPLHQHPVYFLLEQTRRLVETSSFDAFRQLLRAPDWFDAMVAAVETGLGQPVSRTGLLGQMDRLAVETLPDTLGDALGAVGRRFRNHPELEKCLQWAQGWVQKFRRQDFGDTLIEYLVCVFENRTSDPRLPTSDFPEVANYLMQSLDALREAARIFTRKLSAPDHFELLLSLIGEKRIYPERLAQNIDLEGWVELLWEDAPHLVVTGMNDSCVPESVVSHAYLPDSTRRFLGMADNDRRFARDAYLLTVILESRRASGGRVDLLFGRQSVSGDPLRPSRLLFQCPDAELAGRTLQFFSGETGRRHHPLPWKLAWQLKPRPLPQDAKIFQRLSVTAFKSYLTCPFRFYLRFGLGMEELEREKSEMNAMEFGNLVHDALEAFAKDPEASLSNDAAAIRDFFHAQIDRSLYYHYGTHWTTPIVIQREAARQRLGWWAETEAEQRQAGWRIIDPESRIGSEEQPFRLAGMPISGRIDRIEQHPRLGYRVLDFKTFSPGEKSVIDFHITPVRRNERVEEIPPWQLLTNEDGKISRWTDLQLPLYRLALEERFPGETISVGYVTLGKTRKEVAMSMWDEIEQRYLRSARACAEGVIAAVREQRFWPPAERLPYRDGFEELFFGDPRDAVDPDGLTGFAPPEELRKSA